MTTDSHVDAFDDLDRLRLVNSQTGIPSQKVPSTLRTPKRIQGEFLKGPIPLNWLTIASELRGKSPLAVALAVWFQVGRRKSMEVVLTSAVLERFGVKRKAKYTALHSLEVAGLLRVQRRPRRNPIVTVLDVPDASNGNDSIVGDEE